MRRTKIVCTLGPATDTVEVLEKVVLAGMDVARFNFSHGTHQEQRERLALLRQVANKHGKRVSVMLDTKGPEIRLGLFEEGQAVLKTGSRFSLTTKELLGTSKVASVTYQELPQILKVDDVIYLDDGNIILKVIRSQDQVVDCEIVDGGIISNRKKVNLPDIPVNLPALTKKDIDDIEFAVKHGFDYIAASFIKSADDVLAIREVLEQNNSSIKIIAKIENRQGVTSLHRILAVADGIMVARGDLGVEIPAEEVPLRQKEMISACNALGKPVIIATQMLDSMIRNPRPTRAEASDVANAIFDGADAVMLSGETAAGKFPIESVEMMNRIAVKTEQGVHYTNKLVHIDDEIRTSVTEAIGQAVCRMAVNLNAPAIITPTQSGYTARIIAKYRPESRIIAVTPNEQVANELKLIWGVHPIIGEDAINTDELLEDSVGSALEQGLIKNGDLVVITAGVPVARPGSTNLIKVHTVGNIISRGIGIGKQSVTAPAYLANDAEHALDMPDGHILICKNTDKRYVSTIERAGGIVTECGGLTSHAAIVGLHLGKPVIVNAASIIDKLTSGQEITLDSERGLIYLGKATVL